MYIPTQRGERESRQRKKRKRKKREENYYHRETSTKNISNRDGESKHV